MPKAIKPTTTRPDALSPLTAKPHSDAALLSLCAELVAIEADTQTRPLYEARCVILKKDILDTEPVTLEGCRARLRAIEAAWPDVLDRLHGSLMGPEDEAYWRDYKRLPREETGAAFRARLKAKNDAKDYPSLSPDEVLERALGAASKRTTSLYDGLLVLDALTDPSDGTVMIRGDALEWLVKRLKKDADDIQEDIEYAERAREGGMFTDANVRYAVSGGMT
jgi:hypothetical protein